MSKRAWKDELKGMWREDAEGAPWTGKRRSATTRAATRTRCPQAWKMERSATSHGDGNYMKLSCEMQYEMKKRSYNIIWDNMRWGERWSVSVAPGYIRASQVASRLASAPSVSLCQIPATPASSGSATPATAARRRDSKKGLDRRTLNAKMIQRRLHKCSLYKYIFELRYLGHILIILIIYIYHVVYYI